MFEIPKLAVSLSLFATALCSLGQGSSKPTAPGARKLLIEPSTTTVAGGKATLKVSPLSREPGTYGGSYELKLVPYFFKNENGKLSVKISDEALRDLAKGLAISASGQATPQGKNKVRTIKVRTSPSSEAHNHGALTITVISEEGTLIFNSTYRFSDAVK